MALRPHKASRITGPGVSTAHGFVEVATTQPGFPAELTSGWSATTGYSWKWLSPDGLELVDPAIQLTGDNAITLDGDETLVEGTRVWLERDPSDTTKLIITDGAAGGVAWGADWRTATLAFPDQAAVGSSEGPAFDETSPDDVLTVLPDTIIEIPDDIDDVTIEGNLRLGAAITGFSIFPDGYSHFEIHAYVVLLGDDCEPIVVDGGNYGTYPFSGTLASVPSHVVVAGQRLTSGGGGAITANFGHYSFDGGGHWYGDMPAFGRIDAAAIRSYFEIETVRLAWAVSAPLHLVGFPATWNVDCYQTTRPLTWLAWERRGPPTNTVIGCGSGSGGCCDDELADHPDLTINVPDGVAAGDYVAAWAVAVWRVPILVGDAVEIAVIACVDGTWTLNGVVATSQACDPFLATFPAAFGSTGGITVEVA